MVQYFFKNNNKNLPIDLMPSFLKKSKKKLNR